MRSTPDSRPPLRPDAVDPGDGWRLEVVERVGSTNAEAGRRYAAGADAGLVLVAEEQTAGRGRLGRAWVAPPRASLTVSVVLAPPADVDPARWAWLPLLAGIATARALAALGAEVRLKWPNDVLVAPAGGGEDLKVGGILLERVERDPGGDAAAAAVVGLGLNVHQDAAELPVDTATSLALVGVDVGREELLGGLLGQLRAAYDAWLAGADLRPAYLALCATVGRDVRVTVPGGPDSGVEGTAVDVDVDGRLVLRTATGEQRLGAGDVVHVRPAVG